MESSRSSSEGPSDRSSKACDSCRRRKTKCIRREQSAACDKCTSIGLFCTFKYPVLKKGPKLGVARRATSSPEQESWLTYLESNNASTQPASTERVPTSRPSCLPDNMIAVCLGVFFTNVYPHAPLIDREDAQNMVLQVDTSVEAHCIILALCSLALLVSDDIALSTEAPASASSLSMQLCAHVIAKRRSGPNATQALTSAIIIDTFLACIYERSGDDDRAWFYLREATTLSHMLSMHRESYYTGINLHQSTRDRRLHWFLFAAERAHALRSYRPVTLHPTIHALTTYSSSADATQLIPFMRWVELCIVIDAQFLSIWNDEETTSLSIEWIFKVEQKLQLASLVLAACPADLVDVCCLQIWMNVLLWRLAFRKGLVSHAFNTGVLSLGYPCELASSVTRFVNDYPIETLRVHGHLLTKKLFDIACCVLDATAHEFHLQGYRDPHVDEQVNRLLLLVSKLPDTRQQYVSSLLSKIRSSRLESLHSFSSHASFSIVSAPNTSVLPSPTLSSASSSDDWVASPSSLTDIWLPAPPWNSTFQAEWTSADGGAQEYFDSLMEHETGCLTRTHYV